MKHVLLIITALSMSSLTVFSQNISFPLKNAVDSLSYCVGYNVASNIKSQGFNEINVEMIAKAIAHVYANEDLYILPAEAGPYLNTYVQKAKNEVANTNLAAGKKFLEENKKKEGVVTLPSGLQYKILKAGTGAIPLATDKVTTHYHGTLIDGTIFDSSVDRGQPATFPVNGVIQGWIEALQLMPVGSKWTLYIPADLAYGANPRQGGVIKPNDALIFDIELISIEGK